MQRRKQLLGLLVTTVLLVSSASLGGAVIAGSPTAANAAGTDGAWQSARADDGQTGATNASGPNAEYAKTDWRQQYERTEPTGVSIADGTAYVGIEIVHDVAISKGAVAARNATTGELQWKRTGIPKVAGTPTVSGDTVYVATEAHTGTDYRLNESIERGFYAFDAETGETKWKFNGTVNWDRGISPIAAGNTVYGVANDTVYALDSETGEKVRTISLAESYDKHVTQIAMVDGTLYAQVEGSETQIVAVDATSGEQQWSASFDGDSTGFAVTEDAIYVSLQPDTVAKLSTDGHRRWQRKVRADFQDNQPDWVSAPAVDDGTVYVTSNDQVDETGNERASAVHALDAKTGTEDWQFDTDVPLTTAPSVDSDSVYVAGSYIPYSPAMPQTAVYSLDRADGTEQWSYAFGSRRGGEDPFAVAIAGEQVFVADDENGGLSYNGNVYAVSGSDTKPAEEHRLDQEKPTNEDPHPRVEIETTPENAEEQELAGNSTVELYANVTNEETVKSYEWDLDGDGNYEVTGENAEVTVPVCGELEVSVRVTDDDGDGGDTTIETITLSGGE